MPAHVPARPAPRFRASLSPWLLAGLLALAGCGSGGGGGGTPEVGLAVLFPPGYATTSASAVTVRGAIADPSAVTGVEVGGASATTTDAFATWAATVPLAEGENDLAVTVLTPGGPAVVETVRVRRELPFPAEVWESTVDVDGGVAYLLDVTGDLVSVDLPTGARTLLQTGMPSGPMAVDGAAARLYVSTRTGDDHRFEVLDLVTLQWSILSQNGDGLGPDIVSSGNQAPRIAVDPVAGLLLVAVDVGSGDPDRLIGIDLQTGVRALLATVQGASSTALWDVAARPGSGLAYLFDGATPAVWTVDLATGAGTERTFDRPASLITRSRFAVDGPTNRAFVYTGDVYAVDLVTGQRTDLSRNQDHPPELTLFSAASIALDAANQRLLPIGRGSKRIVAVDVTSGARSVAHDGGFGNPALFGVEGLVAEGANTFLASDERRGTIERGELATATRSALAGPGEGAGPDLVNPKGMVPAPDGTTVYVLDNEQSLLAVDTGTGNRRVVSSSSVGTGAPVDTWVGLVCTPSGELYVLDDSEYWILRIDPATGDRTLLSGGGAGAGPEMNSADGLAYDAAGSQLYVSYDKTIVRVDAVTGDRTPFFDGTTALPGTELSPDDFFFTPDGTALYFTGTGLLHGVYRVDTATRAVTVVHDPATTTSMPLRSASTGMVRGGTPGLAFVLDGDYRGLFALDLTTGEAVLTAR